MKVWRDWLNDEEGDESQIFIQGVAAYHLREANVALASAAQTPWNNEVTLQSFLNIAGTEPQDHAYRIKQPALYMVNENDPFNVAPAVHKKVFDRMGANAEFQVIPSRAGGQLADQLVEGVERQIEWLRKVL